MIFIQQLGSGGSTSQGGGIASFLLRFVMLAVFITFALIAVIILSPILLIAYIFRRQIFSRIIKKVIGPSFDQAFNSGQSPSSKEEAASSSNNPFQLFKNLFGRSKGSKSVPDSEQVIDADFKVK